MTLSYDIIVFGGGIAGLYSASRLRRAGYNLILIEKDTLGGAQTLASQGMIHGGQKYAANKITGHVKAMAKMPARWDACFAGQGDINLSGVSFLSNTQLMFPASTLVSEQAVRLASLVSIRPSRKLSIEKVPAMLKRGPVYELQEQVLNTKSLVTALANNLRGRIFRGDLAQIGDDGSMRVSGVAMSAKLVIFAAGAGNEFALTLMNAKGRLTQRRPLRQIMVKPMKQPIYGHGASDGVKPRVTITSHPTGAGEYVWYLGGNIAEATVGMSETETLNFARQEMSDIFPHVNWTEMEWATHVIDRAEAFDDAGRLPAGAYIYPRGNNLFAWPTKMTLVPELSDQILIWVAAQNISPSADTETPALPIPAIGKYPWEDATWRKV